MLISVRQISSLNHHRNSKGHSFCVNPCSYVPRHHRKSILQLSTETILKEELKGSLYFPTKHCVDIILQLLLNPEDVHVSEQLKRQGASIPLVRPGKSTAAFIKTVLSRISVLGSVFLAAGPESNKRHTL